MIVRRPEMMPLLIDNVERWHCYQNEAMPLRYDEKWILKGNVL